MTDRLPVSIVIDSRRKAWCEGECGLDWSKPENQSMAIEAIQSRFGDEVALAFCDLAVSASCGVSGMAAGKDPGPMDLPVLAIKGEPRITGLFDVRMMCLIVEAALENIDD